ncbi:MULTISPECIES: hypothetical protein [unclassified Dehalobacter]|uniref:hypothetical protein n=1 Tax=unclassified Dehalobacter TaxID=2635733 RepID=UPI0010515143|nr:MULTISPECIES: hypothetical protein [unclassified Dehalobacter]TCX51956.1 hypothetical protein C1I36_06460 [Dehalobacter sp. 14DCB1]TCX53016.1 hypothetical protein C1I38_08140 [Dehalobacter sp. 12DCB1]
MICKETETFLDLLEEIEAKDQALKLAREALEETIHLYSLGVLTISAAGDRRKKGTVDDSKRDRARGIEKKALEAIREIDKVLGESHEN